MLATLMILLVAFVLATALWGVLLWLAARRVLRHIRGDAEATRAVVEHVLMPLVGKKPGEDIPPRP